MLTLMNIISDHLSDLWWCSMGLKACALCDVSTSYCMSARAIRRILASSPRAAGPRASANIMTYSPRIHAITSLLHDEVPIYHAGMPQVCT